ncbi:MAG: aspartate--tRNA ligase [Flavobacteriales bacterium]|nr:aspartate--tRNA ligase [Flavobacteriales bacterium]
MLRTHTCGELRITDVGKKVTLCGWLQKSRDIGSIGFIDLRDRYGITQLAFDETKNPETFEKARIYGRECVLRATGVVDERSSKNPKMDTGDIEIRVEELEILNESKTPPFTIEENTDGGDELRMKYRYLDLRRESVRKKIELRHQVTKHTRTYLDAQSFIEIETPVLIKSTPEGARDFVVPSRLNEGEWYALPQSPQTFKQLLMVSGMDKYYQIVKCFRDEDLRADRQPEFTQIDCEMSFVEQDDILNMFEGLTKFVFKNIHGIELSDFPRMSYQEAMNTYGSDKPDTRFEMKFVYLDEVARGKGFGLFDSSESIIAINVKGGAEFTRKQLDELTDFVKQPQIGAGGLIYCRYNSDGTLKSSVDKFFSEENLRQWAQTCNSAPGDLILVLCGKKSSTQKQMNELRLKLGRQPGLIRSGEYKALWVVDFPLLEFDDESGRWHAMHHPFTSPKPEDISELRSSPGKVRANAYDLVINGVEVGGGSIRIHDKKVQKEMFSLLGFTDEQAQAQFGFLMDAFEYGAPPHGGIAFGLDRLCSLLGETDSIRDFIAFPKNNAGRDVMIDAPSPLSKEQLEELGLK